MSFSRDIANIATKALIKEVAVTPKPGLVDRFNSGSHEDMDYFKFIDSAFSIADYFEACVKVGLNTDIPPLSFGILRKLGQYAEKRMYSVTNGVNTHKGMIFSGGIICAAVGILKKRGEEFTQEKVKDIAKEIASGIENELKEIKAQTYGEILYKKAGLTGARGEVSGGFKSLDGAYEKYLKDRENLGYNLAMAKAIIGIMTKVDDSNIAGRGGLEMLHWIKSKAKEILEECDGGDILKSLEEFDKLLTDKNLSPGGAADLLTVLIFLDELENYFKNLSDISKEILNDREERGNLLLEISKNTEKTVISFKLNYPGVYKNGAFQDIAFDAGVYELKKLYQLTKNNYVIKNSKDGKYMVFLLDKDFKKVKEDAVYIEENHILGRLFDIDVYKAGKIISRRDFGAAKRNCLICTENAADCARENNHSDAEITEYIENLIFKYLRKEMAYV